MRIMKKQNKLFILSLVAYGCITTVVLLVLAFRQVRTYYFSQGIIQGEEGAVVSFFEAMKANDCKPVEIVSREEKLEFIDIECLAISPEN